MKRVAIVTSIHSDFDARIWKYATTIARCVAKSIVYALRGSPGQVAIPQEAGLVRC
jgi:hypothetical protein